MLSADCDKAAVRRTRKDLSERIRDDWEELIIQALAAGDSSAQRNAELAELALPPSDAVEWRERTYASSDPSSNQSTDSDEPAPAPTTARRYSKNGLIAPPRRIFRKHHCMFPDGSDADGESSTDSQRERERRIVRRKQERSGRRRRRLEEEMAWNDGLRNWERTRDVWCRVRRASVSSVLTPTSSSTGTSFGSAPDMPPVEHGKLEKSGPTPPLLEPAKLQVVRRQTQLPIPAPIIPPTDPGRLNIKSQYSTIYDKVVLESLRPQVPINLSDLVPALVKGWKANNEWPPKPTPLAAVAKCQLDGTGKTRKASAGNGAHGGKGALELVAEKGRRLLWHGHGHNDSHSNSNSEKGAPKLKSVDAVGHEGEAKRRNGTSSPRTSQESGEKEKGSSPLSVRTKVARMSKALKGSLGGGSEA